MKEKRIARYIMAFLQMNYHSKTLQTDVTVNVILPDVLMTEKGRKCKTLYLLHGLSGDHTSWTRKTSIERYAAGYDIAVVMPAVGRSWYTDTAYGAKYFTFITKELPSVCQAFYGGLSDKREDNFIAGLSMGGYGCMKAALAFSEFFGGCASLSGALDVADASRVRPLDEWRGIAGFDINGVADLKDTCHDLFHLAKQNKEAGKPFPRIYLWCGEQDVLFDQNNRFHAHLDELGVEHLYETSEGDHSWKWWDLHIQDALKYHLG